MGREGLRAHIAVLRAKAHRVRFDLQSSCSPFRDPPPASVSATVPLFLRYFIFLGFWALVFLGSLDWPDPLIACALSLSWSELQQWTLVLRRPICRRSRCAPSLQFTCPSKNYIIDVHVDLRKRGFSYFARTKKKTCQISWFEQVNLYLRSILHLVLPRFVTHSPCNKLRGKQAYGFCTMIFL